MFDTNAPAVFYNGTEPLTGHRVWLRRTLIDPSTPGYRFRPFVMALHNPSIAGAVKNDPTATRGISFAVAQGATDLIFVNAIDLIATKMDEVPADTPAEALTCPWSDWALQEAARLALDNNGWLVAAWGAPKGRAAIARHIAARYQRIKELGLPWSVLRLTASGYPEHPLYLPSHLIPIRWEYQ